MWIRSPPQRAITMNQGTTEILLALGLADRTVGTAYLDDHIWGELAEAYSQIPVLSDEYPNATQIRDLKPDFIYAAYPSAFSLSYVNFTAGAFPLSDCELVVTRDSEENVTFCREELYEDANISTYLQAPFCERTEDRPDAVSLDVLTDEIYDIATIFDVIENARELIDTIQYHFDQAKKISNEEMGKVTQGFSMPGLM